MAFDVDHPGVVEQPVEDRGSDDRVAEDLVPLAKAAIGAPKRASFDPASPLVLI
jgi:hypothetical protein